MSTINTYFITRKSTSNNNNSSSNHKSNDTKVAALKKVESTTNSFFAAQAPQPIYEVIKKPAQSTIATKTPFKQSLKKNSILYYLSPVHNNNENNTNKNESTSNTNQNHVTTSATTQNAAEEEKEEKVVIPCRIRLNIPLTRVWNDILQEFDPESYTNQQDPLYEQEEKDRQEKQSIEYMDVSCGTLNSRRRKLEEENSCELRNVRIRSISYQQQLNTTLEDYLFEDIQEDLSRPLRTKYSLNQTNVYLLNIINEVLILSDNSWFIQ